MDHGRQKRPKTEVARVTWEYPRDAGAGEQMDIVEVMEIRDGLIQHHRVYWGSYSVRLYETLKPQGATECALMPAASGSNMR